MEIYLASYFISCVTFWFGMYGLQIWVYGALTPIVLLANIFFRITDWPYLGRFYLFSLDPYPLLSGEW